jgi:hypothetical protein
MTLKLSNFDDIMIDLKISINMFPDILNKLELNINSVKKLSLFFSEYKDQIDQLSNNSNHTLQLLKSKLSNDVLNVLTVEAAKSGHVVVKKEYMTKLENENETLQKIIDCKLEKEIKKLEDKSDEELNSKISLCKLIAEKDNIKLQSIISMKDFELEFLKNLNNKTY